MNKFQIGDKVIIIKRRAGHKFKIGDEIESLKRLILEGKLNKLISISIKRKWQNKHNYSIFKFKPKRGMLFIYRFNIKKYLKEFYNYSFPKDRKKLDNYILEIIRSDLIELKNTKIEFKDDHDDKLYKLTYTI